MGEESALPESLIVGHILGPQGTKGELKIRVATDFPDRFSPGREVYLDGRALEIESSRPHKQDVVLKLSGIDTRTDAENLRGGTLTVPRSELRSLPEGEYYAFQLVGIEVVTTAGAGVGRIIDIMMTAGNDVYVVQGERGEILIPAIEDVVKSIDLETGRMVIEAIDGLLPPP
jgi:16S rRNA processing protein RimM